MKIISSALGRYDVLGNPKEADCIIGHSFGTTKGDGSVNRSLADLIVANADERPVIVDRTLVSEFPLEQHPSHIVDGPISNAIGQGVGTWGVLVEAKAFMKEEGLQKALMVAQAHHIGRVAMQADKLEIDYIIPANLPSDFDRTSEQIFTRSFALWLPREVIGSLVLKAQGKL